MGDRLGIPGAVGIFVYFAVGYVGTIAFSQQKIAFEEVLVYSHSSFSFQISVLLQIVTDNLQFCLNVHETFLKVQHLVVFVEAE